MWERIIEKDTVVIDKRDGKIHRQQKLLTF